MDINISDLIFAVINFLIMVGILTYFLYKPIIRILDTRKEKIETENSEAKTLLEEAKAARESSEKEIIAAHQEAARLVQEATREGEIKKQSLLEEAKEKSELAFRNAQSDMKIEREKVKMELKEEVVTLAVYIARKIMTSSVPVSSSNRIEELVLQISTPENLKKIGKKITELGKSATVELITSEPLSDKERSLINKVLCDADAPNATVLETVSDEIVGGSILFVGDLMFDGSISNKLDKIGKEIL